MRRVGIVELDGDFLGKRAPVGVAAAEAPHEVGQRAGHQEILLHEAQPLPHARGVVGIQYPGERFGRERLGQRADEIAAAESLKVEVIRGRGGPEPKRVDGLAAVADHGAVERDADQRGRLAGDGTQVPAAELERAVQLDFHLLVRASDLPGVRRGGASCPAVRAASRPGWSDERCRIRTADRSPWPEAASWPSSRGNKRPGARARRCPGPHRVPVQAGRANRGSSP